jgi:hypothetical protein
MLEAYAGYEKDKDLDPTKRGTCKRFVHDEINTPDQCHPNYLLRYQSISKSSRNNKKI